MTSMDVPDDQDLTDTLARQADVEGFVTALLAAGQVPGMREVLTHFESKWNTTKKPGAMWRSEAGHRTEYVVAAAIASLRSRGLILTDADRIDRSNEDALSQFAASLRNDAPDDALIPTPIALATPDDNPEVLPFAAVKVRWPSIATQYQAAVRVYLQSEPLAAAVLIRVMAEQATKHAATDLSVPFRDNTAFAKLIRLVDESPQLQKTPAFGMDRHSTRAAIESARDLGNRAAHHAEVDFALLYPTLTSTLPRALSWMSAASSPS